MAPWGPLAQAFWPAGAVGVEGTVGRTEEGLFQTPVELDGANGADGADGAVGPSAIGARGVTGAAVGAEEGETGELQTTCRNIVLGSTEDEPPNESIYT